MMTTSVLGGWGEGRGMVKHVKFLSQWFYMILFKFSRISLHWLINLYHNCKCGNKWNSNVPNPKPLPVLEVKAINYVYSSTLYSSLKNFTYKHLSLLIVCKYMYIYKYVLLHDELY